MAISLGIYAIFRQTHIQISHNSSHCVMLLGATAPCQCLARRDELPTSKGALVSATRHGATGGAADLEAKIQYDAPQRQTHTNKHHYIT